MDAAFAHSAVADSPNPAYPQGQTVAPGSLPHVPSQCSSADKLQGDRSWIDPSGFGRVSCLFEHVRIAAMILIPYSCVIARGHRARPRGWSPDRKGGMACAKDADAQKVRGVNRYARMAAGRICPIWQAKESLIPLLRKPPP